MIKKSKAAYRRGRMIAVLDAACRERTVIERDGNICQRCDRAHGTYHPDGYPVLAQWSHIESRRHYCLRWDDENSLCHCSKCHVWFENNPVLGIDWFIKKFPERWERITRILLLNPKTDIKAKYEELKGMQ